LSAYKKQVCNQQ